MAWTYSDYVTYDYGATRLARFRSHVQEVSDALTAELRDRGGNQKSTEQIRAYLADLRAREDQEIAAGKSAAGSGPTFIAGRPRYR